MNADRDSFNIALWRAFVRAEQKNYPACNGGIALPDGHGGVCIVPAECYLKNGKPHPAESSICALAMHSGYWEHACERPEPECVTGLN